ncbi:MAG: hypothetical protein HY738_16830 [Bacteroidia bacterium]|nr:hypothetical protein [Bacteroidia bacterium]
MLKKKHKEKNIYKHERGLHYKPLSKILLISVIAILCVISYLPAYKNNITNWDDDRYISKNPYITSLSFFNVKEIFSNFYFCNYHPLTMLSLALDYSIGGTSPFVFHFTNVLLHIINSLLVFWLVLLVLNDLKTAFFCGLLFGVHTLHVESVAWIAERKDVLYSLFYLLSFISYIKYIKLTRKDALPKISACAIAVTPNEVSLRVRVNYYLLSLVLFIMSVLSKGMAVTLPLVLIATDYFYNRKLLSKKIIAEKIPFLIISLIFGIIAILAQKTETAISGLESYRLDESIVFACYALFQYVLKLLLPAGLSSFYPYPSEISWFFWFYPLIIMLIIAIIVFSLISWIIPDTW